MAEFLAFPTLDHEVLSLNLAGGRIQLMTAWGDCTEPLFITLSGSLYDLNDIEKDVKHQTIIITFKDKYLFVLRFYGPVNPRGSCRARSVYLT